MDGLFDVYLRYERCFGAVRLVNPSRDEERVISDFFNRDYYNQALIRISLAEFERQCQRLFAPDITLGRLLETYMKRPLHVRKTEVRSHSSAFAVYAEQTLAPRYRGTDAELWIKDLMQNTRRAYRDWAQEYTENPTAVAGYVEAICEAVNHLPMFRGGPMRLPDFAARFVEEDAHAYDYAGRLGFYFMRALARTLDAAVPINNEEYSALCMKAGLLTEGVLSKVTLRGVTVTSDRADGAVCAVYAQRREPHILTLENMCGFEAAEAVDNKV
jgi:hypothetical protein